MRVWIIQDDLRRADNVRDAITDQLPGIEVTCQRDWCSGEDRLTQFCQRVTTCLSPGDIVVLDLGLPLGRYAGLDLFQALHDWGVIVLFDTGSSWNNPAVQKAIAERNLQATFDSAFHNRWAYWFPRRTTTPEEIAGRLRDILADRSSHGEPPRTSDESPEELWWSFKHDCCLPTQDVEAWYRLREDFHQVDEKLRRLETPHQKFFAEERQRLAECFKGPTPDFECLRQAGIEIPEHSVQPAIYRDIPPHPFFPATIMVIEDEPSWVEWLERELRGMGHTVVPLLEEDLSKLARNTNTIVELIKEKKVEVVLLDLELSKNGNTYEGFDILKAIKKQSGATKVIVLTAHGEDVNVDEAINFGADGYLYKATSLEQKLTDEIRRILTRRVILIVDDQPWSVFTDVLQQHLVEWRCDFILCTSADELLDGIAQKTLPRDKRTKINLVLLDLKFGDLLRGKELLGPIQEWQPELPVFVLTALKDPAIRVEVRFGDPRPHRYLYKPISEPESKEIWDVLFKPAEAVLSRHDKMLRLFSDNGSMLPEVRLPLKEWTVACWFFQMRLNHQNDDGVRLGEDFETDFVTYQEDLDIAVEAASCDALASEKKAIEKYKTNWDSGPLRTAITHIHTDIWEKLGHKDWQLIESPDGWYSLSKSLMKVEAYYGLLPDEVYDDTKHQAAVRWIKSGRLREIDTSLKSLKKRLQNSESYNTLVQNAGRLASVAAFFAILPRDRWYETLTWLGEQGFTKLVEEAQSKRASYD